MGTAAAEARVLGQLAESLRLPIAWLPDLRVFHEDPRDLDQVLRQKFRHGAGRRYVWARTPEVGHLRDRYFRRPIDEVGLPSWYVIPAHLAFLLGYREALVQAGKATSWWSEVLGLLSSEFKDTRDSCLLVSNATGVVL